MKKIGIAIIGWGFMGRTHTYALRALPLMYEKAPFRPVLKCLCTRNSEALNSAAEDMGFERRTTDWHDILSMDDVDVVSICTPNGAHEEMIAAFLKAGKHLYIDKPLTVNAESADRLLKLSQSSASLTRMVMNNRFLPATLKAAEICSNKLLGSITGFSARYLHSGSIDPNKLMGWKQGLEGGVLLDLGSHILDLVTLLCGYPKELVCAFNTLYPTRITKTGETETRISEDQAVLMLRMPGGALGTVEASKVAYGTQDELTFEIYGTSGAIKFNLMEPGVLWFNGKNGFQRLDIHGTYPPPGGSFFPSKNAIGWERGHIHCYYTFLDEVYRGIQGTPSLADGAKLQRLMGAALTSVKEGRWVEFNKYPPA